FPRFTGQGEAGVRGTLAGSRPGYVAHKVPALAGPLIGGLGGVLDFLGAPGARERDYGAGGRGHDRERPGRRHPRPRRAPPTGTLRGATRRSRLLPRNKIRLYTSSISIPCFRATLSRNSLQRRSNSSPNRRPYFGISSQKDGFASMLAR